MSIEPLNDNHNFVSELNFVSGLNKLNNQVKESDSDSPNEYIIKGVEKLIQNWQHSISLNREKIHDDMLKLSNRISEKFKMEQGQKLAGMIKNVCQVFPVPLQSALNEKKLKPLFEMVNVLYEWDCLPESKLAYAVGREIDLEGTLSNLENFTVSDLIETYEHFLFVIAGRTKPNIYKWKDHNKIINTLKEAFNRFKTFISKFPIADIEQIDDDDIVKLNIELNKKHIKITLDDDGKKAFWDFSKSRNKLTDRYDIAQWEILGEERYNKHVYYDLSGKLRFLAGVVSSIKESKRKEYWSTNIKVGDWEGIKEVR